jgi:hypothetical protein
MKFSWMTIAAVLAMSAAGVATGPALAAAGDDGDLARAATWAVPTGDAVRRRTFDWLTQRPQADGVPAEVSARAEMLWYDSADAAPRDTLDLVMATIELGDPRMAPLRERVLGAAFVGPLPAWLDQSDTAPFARDAVRLWLGRQLVRLDRFDEALPLLVDLDVAASVDPAALLFHRAACQHWLLDAEAAIASLDQLLERAGEIPVRYERLARLLRADAAALENDSLDHIARRMKDISRRLDLGKAGPTTRRVQEGVVESLDKLIKQIEDQQQQDQGQGGGGAGGQGQDGSGKPMDESRIAGGRGKGDVRKKDIGSADGWGNLPPHQREEALQQIGREFPPHYREAIEQYFKRLASGGEDR